MNSEFDGVSFAGSRTEIKVDIKSRSLDSLSSLSSLCGLSIANNSDSDYSDNRI